MHERILAAAFAILTPAMAQDAKPAGQPAAAQPGGRATPYDALAMFVGDWDSASHTRAVPGVPGRDKELHETGVEHAELICNGQFLKATMQRSSGGVLIESLAVLGYDPAAKRYTFHWADSSESAPVIMTGEFDAAKKAWSWSGVSRQRQQRNECVMRADGGSSETCWIVDDQGKEWELATVTRTPRQAQGVAPSIGVPLDPQLGAEHQRLLQDVGEWTAVVTIEMGGRSFSSNATEQVRAICGGRWTWSDYRGEMNGKPFDAHALTGYDPVAKEYVGFWFDAGKVSTTRGTYDSTGKVLTMAATTADANGKPSHLKKVTSHTTADSRTQRTEFSGGGRNGSMEIVYTRKPK